jgi:electron transfer flavoprotein alpha subunit
MKAILVGEYREGKLLDSTYELVAFAEKLGVETSMFLVGNQSTLPQYDGKLYLADAQSCQEYNPDVHKKLLLNVIEQETPNYIIFAHSSYGWDLAPRIAASLKAAQVSEVVDLEDGAFVLSCCNAKMRRNVTSKSDVTVVTVQAGAFGLDEEPSGTPTVENLEIGDLASTTEFVQYEQAEKTGVDLTKAEIIVSAGRGIGTKDNVEMVSKLANVLGGELGSSRPVTDSGWIDQSQQVGTTGQTVTPKLYIACGISGAIQHLAGMKKSEFIVAINTDKDCPMSEVADVLVVADLTQFVPALTEKIISLK